MKVADRAELEYFASDYQTTKGVIVAACVISVFVDVITVAGVDDDVVVVDAAGAATAVLL